jgi:hypothetical protein
VPGAAARSGPDHLKCCVPLLCCACFACVWRTPPRMLPPCPMSQTNSLPTGFQCLLPLGEALVACCVVALVDVLLSTTTKLLLAGLGLGLALVAAAVAEWVRTHGVVALLPPSTQDLLLNKCVCVLGGGGSGLGAGGWGW